MTTTKKDRSLDLLNDRTRETVLRMCDVLCQYDHSRFWALREAVKIVVQPTEDSFYWCDWSDQWGTYEEGEWGKDLHGTAWEVLGELRGMQYGVNRTDVLNRTDYLFSVHTCLDLCHMKMTNEGQKLAIEWIIDRFFCEYHDARKALGLDKKPTRKTRRARKTA